MLNETTVLLFAVKEFSAITPVGTEVIIYEEREEERYSRVMQIFLK